jgi:hypothetical protein
MMSRYSHAYIKLQVRIFTYLHKPLHTYTLYFFNKPYVELLYFFDKPYVELVVIPGGGIVGFIRE